MWLLPAVALVVATAAAIVLSRVGLGQPDDPLGFGGTPDGARALVSTVAGSIITVTSVTFTLTMVALQVAASQFSPRILRSFLADRGNHAVLATFLATFAFSVVTLRSIRGGAGPSPDAFVPHVAVAGTVALTALSVAMLVYFIHHITQQLRVEAVLEELQEETLDTVRRILPLRDDRTEDDLPIVPDGAVTIRARESGYLQMVDLDALHRTALRHGVALRVRPRPGGPITRGTSLVWAWPVTGAGDGDGDVVGDLDGMRLADEVHDGLVLGFERTMRQDVAFGIRQMVDVAVRALSIGLNDPATAVATIGALAPVLAELTGRSTGHRLVRDGDGRVRVAFDAPSFGELLALGCDQPRRYASGEPAVLVALLEMLGDLAELDAPDTDAIAGQVAATVDVARGAGLSTHELERVELAARRARATLAGGVRVARTPSEEDLVEEPAG